MQKKTIRKVLNKKFKEWTDSITDSEVKKAVKENTIITGGAIASMLLGEEVKDFDVYFRNKDTVKKVAEYYVGNFKEKHSLDITIEETDFGRIKINVRSKGVTSENNNVLQEPLEDIYDVISDADEISEDMLNEKDGEKYRPIFLSPNAITLANKIQCVLRFYGEPEEIHETYDFVHATNYWASWENEVVLSIEALESIMSKQLIYNGSKYPICSVIRTRKFIKRDWNINAGQYLKMMWQVSQLDLNDMEVLEDQLVGVDSAYFNEFIEALKRKKEKNPEWELTDTYLCSVIDKIF